MLKPIQLTTNEARLKEIYLIKFILVCVTSGTRRGVNNASWLVGN